MRRTEKKKIMLEIVENKKTDRIIKKQTMGCKLKFLKLKRNICRYGEKKTKKWNDAWDCLMAKKKRCCRELRDKEKY